MALERPEAGRHPAYDVHQDGPLDLRAVDRGARRPRQRRDRADVIEVAVGHEDRLDLDTELLRRLQQPLGLFARVDHHGLPGLRSGSHDVSVLLHRADCEGADVQATHWEAAFPPPPRLALLRWRSL